MSVPANNDSTQFGASRNAAVLSNYLPAIGTRVVIAADNSLPADADAVLVALIDGEDGLELAQFLLVIRCDENLHVKSQS